MNRDRFSVVLLVVLTVHVILLGLTIGSLQSILSNRETCADEKVLERKGEIVKCHISGCENLVPALSRDDEEAICEECEAMVKRMNRSPLEQRLDRLEARVRALEARAGRSER